jgi:protein involved in polysaccharide export with SLBB domain
MIFRAIAMQLPTLVVLVVSVAFGTRAAWAQSSGPDSSGAPVGQAGSPLPGDQIVVRIPNEPTITGTYTIREAGEVVLPKLGPLVVTGQPIVALQDSLRDAYVEYVRNPAVEVVVLRRIRVGGEVRSPGIYMADLTMRLPEIIAAAGGFTEAANPNHVLVIRGDRELRYQAREHHLFTSAELSSGDQVMVRPRSSLARNPIGTSTAIMGAALTFVTVLLPALRGIFR